MSEYRFHHSGVGVIRLSDTATIMPGDTSGWREYLEWMYAGNEALPAVQPPAAPRPRLPKSVIVDRMTDEELEMFRSIKPSLPARLTFLWDEALNNTVNAEDERLISAFNAILGVERTAEILRAE